MRAAFHLILATWLALGSVTVRAADDLHLYQAAAPVADHSEGARADALRRALAGVLVKVSGQAAVAQRASAQAILDRAATLVQRYGYQQRMPATTGQEQAPAPTPPEPKLWLTAVFDDVAVNRALLAAGLPVWGGKRPRTMVWVALGGRDGKLLTPSGSEAAWAAVQDAARTRGVPLLLPQASVGAQGRVTIADVVSGNQARLMAVARVHGSSHLLIGSVVRDAGGWYGHWQLVNENGPMGAWGTSGSSRAQVLGDAVQRLAELYAQEFAVAGAAGGGSGSQGVVVAVTGIGNARNYTRVSHYLSGLDVVEWASPVLVQGQTVVFRLRSAGSASVLGRVIDLANWLAPDAQARQQARAIADGALGYRLIAR